MKECHAGNKRLPGMEQLPFPLRGIEPCKLPIDPDPCVRDRGGSFFLDIDDIDSSVQFLTDMRPVNITEIVVLVKIQQQFSIPKWQVTRHGGFLLCSRFHSEQAFPFRMMRDALKVYTNHGKINDLPVISIGCGIPIICKIVGATCAKIPSVLNFACTSCGTTRYSGTGNVVCAVNGLPVS